MRPAASPTDDMLTMREGTAAASEGSSRWASSAGPKKSTARVYWRGRAEAEGQGAAAEREVRGKGWQRGQP